MNMVTGFMYSGTPRVLASLWKVDDQATAELMKEFYKEWRAGATRARALQKAMQTVRLTYPNPFYWAPFVLVGKT